MTELRKNEFKDLLEMNEILVLEFEHYIAADIPEIGTINYYPKSNRIQIHKGNKWENDGYNFIKKHFKKLEENLYTKKEVIDFFDWATVNAYKYPTKTTTKELLEIFKKVNV